MVEAAIPSQDRQSGDDLRLFLVSLIILFAEVMCIRWVGVELPVLRVFPNLILTTIFIGSSVGLATYKKPGASPAVVATAAIGIALLLILSSILNTNKLTLQLGSDQSPVNPLLSVCAIAFVLTNLTVAFMALGRALGKLFETEAPLKAYSINLLGSLAGVLLFGITSWLWQPPGTWMIVLSLALWFLAKKKSIALNLIIPLVLILASLFLNNEVTWSPYGKITISPLHALDKTILGQGNYVLSNNNGFFHKALRILPLTGTNIEGYKAVPTWEREARQYLEIPYVLNPSPNSVLILGSGSGDDVECAIVHGVKNIDAVEIDPFIGQCGQLRHPQKPYMDPAAHLHVEDARTFLRSTNNKYDLIQFAYLDPGYTLKLSSFLRIDNFVYTKESIQSALAHLTDNGIVTLSFATGADSAVTRRLYKTISEAYGKPPMSYVQESTGSCLFYFGPGLKVTSLPQSTITDANVRSWPRKGEFTDTQTATDDWPFLYLDFSNNAITIWLYAFVLLTAAIAPLMVLRKGVSGQVKLVEAAPMTFLGMAFMLVETKSITQLSLQFGATWLVSSVVIFLILLLAFSANTLVDRFRLIKLELCYLALFLALIIDYFWRVPDIFVAPLAMSSALVTCMPVFFGGMIFSILLRKSSNPVMSLATNVLGVAFGGLLENFCVLVGIKNLSLVALVIYALSLAACKFPDKTKSQTLES